MIQICFSYLVVALVLRLTRRIQPFFGVLLNVDSFVDPRALDPALVALLWVLLVQLGSCGSSVEFSLGVDFNLHNRLIHKSTWALVYALVLKILCSLSGASPQTKRVAY